MTDQTRAVARYDGPRTIDELARYSEMMADGTTVLPVQYRRQPGSIMFAVEYAKALDVSPITAITGIHVIEGKPTASAGLISALIRRAGHKLRVKIEGTLPGGDIRAVATLTRHDDPDEPFVSTWDLDRARRAGLLTIVVDPNTGRVSVTARGKNGGATPWETYTESMLKARAITEVGRDGAEDVLLGVHYTPEELGAEVDAAGEIVHTVTTVPSTRTDAPTQAPAAGGPPSSTAGSTSGGGETQTPPPPGPVATPDTSAVVGDTVRAAILLATTLEELGAIWTNPPISATSANAAALEIGDEAGALTTVLELFKRQADAIKAENPLVDLWAGRDGDEGGSPAEPSGDPGNGPQTGGEGRTYTSVEEAIDDATRPPNDVVDAVVVEDTPRSTVTEQTYRSVLDRVVVELTRAQLDDLTSWCRLNGAHPDGGDDHCRIILAAIKDGTAFSFANRPDNPVALVERVLGGSVVEEERVTDPEELHRREIAERHEEARQATPAGHGPRGTGHDAFAAARAANRTTTDQ